MKAADVRMIFRVNAAFVDTDQTVCLSGSIPQLGSVRYPFVWLSLKARVG